MSPSGGFWSLMTILGPLLLAVVIAWALLKNRKASKSEVDRTEWATHDLYKAQDAQDKHDGPAN